MMSKTLPLLLMTSALALAACSGKSKDDVASPSTNPALAVPNGPPAVANPTVGGVPMMATRTIVDNASAAPNLSTLVAAVKAADLVGTLSGPGPFTVFAPTNDAFGRLAPGMVDTLLKPESAPTLATIIKYHVVAGAVTSDQLKAQITAGGGKATLTTLAGQPLIASLGPNGNIELTDTAGIKSYVDTADIKETNGVVHLTNGMSVPKLG